MSRIARRSDFSCHVPLVLDFHPNIEYMRVASYLNCILGMLGNDADFKCVLLYKLRPDLFRRLYGAVWHRKEAGGG